MKVAGIIAEYNPFHNGHAYHIEEVRKRTSADYVVVVMSGNFMQRGAPAIVDKYTRTKMALLGGADLVIELPVVAATASAETFARAGVSILHSLGCVTHLGFGCETDNLDLLDQLATLFVDEPDEYRLALSFYLKEGLSYPTARARAAKGYFLNHTSENKDFLSGENTPRLMHHNIGECIENIHDAVDDNNKLIEDTLNNPNNILAIEYIKALKQLNSSIQPCPILRKGNGYHDVDITENHASATAIRKKLLNYDICDTDITAYNNRNKENISSEKLKKIMSSECDKLHQFLQSQIPDAAASVLSEVLKQFPSIQEDDFSSLLHYKLCLEQDNYCDYADVKEDLANRIMNIQEQFASFSGFIEDVKTKNMTYTGVSRALLHILLGIKQHDVSLLKQTNYAPYARVLGFRKNASLLMTALKESSSPVLTQLAKDQAALPEESMRLLQLDISSAHIYNVVRNNKSGLHCTKNEYRTPLIIV